MKLQREKKQIEAGSNRRGTALMSITGNPAEVRNIEKVLDLNWNNTMCEDIEDEELTIFYAVQSNMVAEFRAEYKDNK